MRDSRHHSLLWVGVLALAAGSAMARGVGDWVGVSLRDGREFFGQVVEENEFKLILNVKQGAISAKMTLARSDIREIRPQSQSVRSAAPENDSGALSSEKESETLATAAPGSGGYVVAPLEGVFGEDLTAGLVRAILQRAVDAKAEAVVLELKSAGGAVSELDRVRQTIDSFEGKLKVAIYVPSEAFSAAALLCMSNREFYVAPGARLGAAVAFQESSTGSKEVDAKYNSAFAARWRGLTEKVGRPGLLVDAMVVLERRVYADTSVSPWKLSAREPSSGAASVEQIDSETTILSLTEREAVGCGAADGSVATAQEVVEKLGLKNAERRAIDGGSFVRAYRKTYERNMATIRRAVEDYNDTSDILMDLQSIRKFEQKLREMRSGLQRIIALYKKFDYVENYFQSRGQSIEDLDRMLRRLNDALKQL